jgi:hypothetical protein
MSSGIPARDQYGNRGTFTPANSGGCFSSLIFWVVIIAVIIGFAIYGVGQLINKVQANILPVHDTLRNIAQGSNGTQYPQECSSDGNGYHVKSAGCGYSGIKYGDVDITVTVKLLSNSSPEAAYGIGFRPDNNGNDLVFAITSIGKWIYNNPDSIGTGSDREGASPAIKKGIGAVNTIEVKTHGHHFTFFVNGVQVGEVDDDDTNPSGAIGFDAGPLSRVPYEGYFINWNQPDKVYNISGNVEAVFTDLTIAKEKL